MGDLISVFGILLAVYTYLESLHHSEIEWAKSVNHDPLNKLKNKPNYIKVKDIIGTKHRVLILISCVICLVMLPESWRIIVGSVHLLQNGTAVYDISQTVVVLINIYFVYTSVVQWKNGTELRSKLEDLKYE